MQRGELRAAGSGNQRRRSESDSASQCSGADAEDDERPERGAPRFPIHYGLVLERDEPLVIRAVGQLDAVLFLLVVAQLSFQTRDRGGRVNSSGRDVSNPFETFEHLRITDLTFRQIGNLSASWAALTRDQHQLSVTATAGFDRAQLSGEDARMTTAPGSDPGRRSASTPGWARRTIASPTAIEQAWNPRILALGGDARILHSDQSRCDPRYRRGCLR